MHLADGVHRCRAVAKKVKWLSRNGVLYYEASDPRAYWDAFRNASVLSWAAFCQYHFMFYVKRFVWDGYVWQIAPVCFFIYAWELQRRGEWNAVKRSLEKWKRNRNSSRYFKRTPAAPWAVPTQRQPSKELHLFSFFYLMYKDFYSASYYLRRMNLWKSFSEEGYSYPQGENGYV